MVRQCVPAVVSVRRRDVSQRGLDVLDAGRVLSFLVRSPLVRLIVLPASRVATLATMVLSAAKGTAEIPTTRIARMREEANPAVAAAHRAVRQIRTIPQDGIQRQLILTNERKGAVVLMPVLAKRENFRDGYRKTVKFSVKMLIVLCISSSYSLDAKASRCRARIFYARAIKTVPRTRTTVPRVSRWPTPAFCPADATLLARCATLLGKKKQFADSRSKHALSFSK